MNIAETVSEMFWNKDCMKNSLDMFTFAALMYDVAVEDLV